MQPLAAVTSLGAVLSAEALPSTMDLWANSRRLQGEGCL